jgi:hypothetical protein
MKVIEEYYGPERVLNNAPWNSGSYGTYGRNQMEAYLRVEVNGRMLHAKKIVEGDRYGPPYAYVMRDLRRQIMLEVEKEVFGS